jgi:hypothetical protein
MLFYLVNFHNKAKENPLQIVQKVFLEENEQKFRKNVKNHHI